MTISKCAMAADAANINVGDRNNVNTLEDVGQGKNPPAATDVEVAEVFALVEETDDTDDDDDDSDAAAAFDLQPALDELIDVPAVVDPDAEENEDDLRHVRQGTISHALWSDIPPHKVTSRELVRIAITMKRWGFHSWAFYLWATDYGRYRTPNDDVKYRAMWDAIADAATLRSQDTEDILIDRFIEIAWQCKERQQDDGVENNHASDRNNVANKDNTPTDKKDDTSFLATGKFYAVTDDPDDVDARKRIYAALRDSDATGYFAYLGWATTENKIEVGRVMKAFGFVEDFWRYYCSDDVEIFTGNGQSLWDSIGTRQQLKAEGVEVNTLIAIAENYDPDNLRGALDDKIAKWKGLSVAEYRARRNDMIVSYMEDEKWNYGTAFNYVYDLDKRNYYEEYGLDAKTAVLKGCSTVEEYRERLEAEAAALAEKHNRSIYFAREQIHDTDRMACADVTMISTNVVIDDYDARKIVTKALTYIKPSESGELKRFVIGCVLRRYAFTFEDFARWCKSDGDAQYSDVDCRRLWNEIEDANKSDAREYFEFQAVVHFAEKCGYRLPRKLKDVLDSPATEPDEAAGIKIDTDKYINCTVAIYPPGYFDEEDEPLDDDTDEDDDDDHTDETAEVTDDKPADAFDRLAFLKSQLRTAKEKLNAFDCEKKRAIEAVKNMSVFDRDTVFTQEAITNAGFALKYDGSAFTGLKTAISIYGERHRDRKTDLVVWARNVKSAADEIYKRETALIEAESQLRAQIRSLEFVEECGLPEGHVIPARYAVEAVFGIRRILERKEIDVCSVPVALIEVNHIAGDATEQLILQFLQKRKWKKLPPFACSTIFDARRLVALSDYGLPVSSTNAKELVDYLLAYHNINRDHYAQNYVVDRCGWHSVKDHDIFVDPRRANTFEEDGNTVNVVVTGSEFTSHLRTSGTLDQWKRAYDVGKKSAVARFLTAAACAAPLLKPLHERNFILHVVGRSRAGKTSAMILAASVVGDEKIIRSFDSTRNGLIAAASDCCDFVFFVDERQLVDARSAELLRTLVYGWAEGVGRSKLNRDSKLKPLKYWRAITITSGETMLVDDNATEGAATRLLTLKAPEEILPPDDCRLIRRLVSQNFGHAFPLAIEKIVAADVEKLRGHFEKLIDTLTARHPEALEEYSRYIALLAMGDALLATALDDALDFDAAITGAVEATEEIFKLIPDADEFDDTIRARNFVEGFIATNQSSFYGGTDNGDRINHAFGKITENYVYVTTSALKAACKAEGYDYRKIVEDLSRSGFFVPSTQVEHGSKSPRVAGKYRIGSVSTRCLRVRSETIGAHPVASSRLESSDDVEGDYFDPPDD